MFVRFVRYVMRHGHCKLPPPPPIAPTYYYHVTWLDKDGNEIEHTETVL